MTELTDAPGAVIVKCAMSRSNSPDEMTAAEKVAPISAHRAATLEPEKAVAADPAHDPHTGAAPTVPVPVSVRHSVEVLVFAPVTAVTPGADWYSEEPKTPPGMLPPPVHGVHTVPL